ncbi:MAG TPA: hypothetical protein VMJ93_00035 [Verrucomicrobiae bacterium]|nr:hypothetical protein [Verrucomicrobiae bacterium]
MNAIWPKNLIVIAAAFVLSVWPPAAARPQQEGPPNPTVSVIDCRAIEGHTSGVLGITAVLFHQRDRKDQALLGEFLKKADGSTVEVRIANGGWKNASVARIRNCFGRGLLLFPAGEMSIKDGDEFAVKFAADNSGK